MNSAQYFKNCFSVFPLLASSARCTPSHCTLLSFESPTGTSACFRTLTTRYRLNRSWKLQIHGYRNFYMNRYMALFYECFTYIEIKSNDRFSYLKNDTFHYINLNGTIGTKTQLNRLQCNIHINQTDVISSLFLCPFLSNQ